jgi:hypothetical protein
MAAILLAGRGFANCESAQVAVELAYCRGCLDVLSGKGAWPVVESTQLGSRSMAPMAPHFVHLLRCRSTLLLESAPYRAMASASLRGALWWQSRASQYIHTHEDCAAIWPSVGIGPGRDLGLLGFATSRLGGRVRMAHLTAA